MKANLLKLNFLVLAALFIGCAPQGGTQSESLSSVSNETAHLEDRTDLELVTQDDMIFVLPKGGIHTNIAEVPSASTSKWPNGEIPVKFDNIADDHQAQFWAACLQWSAAANVRCVPYARQGYWVRVFNSPGSSSSATVGHNPYTSVGEIGTLEAADWCWGYPQCLPHEIGHLFGFKHEHERSDRDTYIAVSGSQAAINCLAPKLSASASVGPFDYQSVMLYVMGTSWSGKCGGDPNTYSVGLYARAGTNVTGYGGSRVSRRDGERLAQLYPGGSSTPQKLVPASPENLTLDAVSSSQIDLDWTVVDDLATFYSIERRTANSAYMVVAIIGYPEITSYSDTIGVSPNTRYFYRVRTANESGYSDPSIEVSVVTPNVGSTNPPPPPPPPPVLTSKVSSLNVHVDDFSKTSYRVYADVGLSTQGEKVNVRIDFIRPDGTRAGRKSFTSATGATKYFPVTKAKAQVGDYKVKVSIIVDGAETGTVTDSTPVLQ